MKRLAEKWSHLLFKIGVGIKGLDGILELIAGLSLLFTSGAAIQSLIHRLTGSELIGDPDDLLANHLVHFMDQLSVGTRHFAAFYLLGHGLVKTGLMAGLLYERAWAFPAALAVLGLFIGYQAYRLTHHYSAALTALTLFDVLVWLVVWRESRYRKAVSKVAA